MFFNMTLISLDLNISFKHNTHECFDLNVEVNHNVDEYSIPDLNLNPNEDDDTQFDGTLQEPTKDSNLNCDSIADLSQSQQTKKNLSNETRVAIYEMLQQKCIDGKLKKGITKIVASHFSTSIQTIQRIWRLSNYGECASNGVYGRKVNNCGRKKLRWIIIIFVQFLYGSGQLYDHYLLP
ncbi:hypothetical protein P3S68_002316 [Capsicum galapagoense]